MCVENLDYMGARYYSPDLGRFLTPDPIESTTPGDPQSWNKYAYALNNPLKYVDPDGKTPIGFQTAMLMGQLAENETFQQAVDVVIDTVSDITEGAGLFFEDHERMFKGFSPVPTSKGDSVLSLAPGAKQLKGVAKLGGRALGNLKALKPKQLGKGVAEEFKRGFVGKSGKRFNIHYDTKTGDVLLVRVHKGDKTIIETDVKIEELLKMAAE